MPEQRDSRHQVPGGFRACADHGGGVASVRDGTQVSMVEGLWEWRGPLLTVTYSCCPERAFDVELEQEWNPEHPLHRGRPLPRDVSRGELPRRTLRKESR
jgi:hypothetical protein